MGTSMGSCGPAPTNAPPIGNMLWLPCEWTTTELEPWVTNPLNPPTSTSHYKGNTTYGPNEVVTILIKFQHNGAKGNYKKKN
jgi:hypothetical protein